MMFVNCGGGESIGRVIRGASVVVGSLSLSAVGGWCFNGAVGIVVVVRVCVASRACGGGCCRGDWIDFAISLHGRA
jgi:hypothetical protein